MSTHSQVFTDGQVSLDVRQGRYAATVEVVGIGVGAVIGDIDYPVDVAADGKATIAWYDIDRAHLGHRLVDSIDLFGLNFIGVINSPVVGAAYDFRLCSQLGFQLLNFPGLAFLVFQQLLDQGLLAGKLISNILFRIGLDRQ